MARYDRIARLDPPAREDAFPGWLAVRDLQHDERDTDLGRRARLRFLAVRLLHRLAEVDSDSTPEDLRLQTDAAREELGQLPARDAERDLLTALMRSVSSGDRTASARSAVELADALVDTGNAYAAEEFYRSAAAVLIPGSDELRTRIDSGLETAIAAQD